jgi:hypothetical protein
VNLDFVQLLIKHELEAAGILRVEEVAIFFCDGARDMKLYVWFSFVVVMQDVAILSQNDKKCFWLKGELQMCINGFVWDNATLPPSPIRDLRGRCQFHCS